MVSNETLPFPCYCGLTSTVHKILHFKTGKLKNREATYEDMSRFPFGKNTQKENRYANWEIVLEYAHGMISF